MSRSQLVQLLGLVGAAGESDHCSTWLSTVADILDDELAISSAGPCRHGPQPAP